MMDAENPVTPEVGSGAWLESTADDFERLAFDLQHASAKIKAPALDEISQRLWKDARTLRLESAKLAKSA